MTLLFLNAYFQLILFHLRLKRGRFNSLHHAVSRTRQSISADANHSIQQISSIVDLACVWYPFRVLCLQRSAATACLLKQHGFAARMIVGVKRLPFRAHAWVEVGDEVVNDKPYVREMFTIIDKW